MEKICLGLYQLLSLNILIPMTKPSFYVALVISLLATTSLCFDIVGSWQLAPNTPPSQPITTPLTFQFDRNIDSSGRISSKLFVYDCFISQFLYQVKDIRISFNFQTSTLLADNCSLSVINQLRNMMQKVFSFQVRYDSLSLVGLNGDAVFVLLRQKIYFAKVMVGAWTLSSLQEKAKYPVRINGSCINLCQDQGQLKYSVQTINGSYPRLKTQVLVNNSCADLSFLNSMSRAVFFQVASNRSQLTFFDSSLKPSFMMNKIGSINADEPLYTAPVVAQNNLISVPATLKQTNQPTQTIVTNTVTNTINTVNTVNNANNANNVNSVSTAPAAPANPPPSTPTVQTIAQPQPIATVMAPSRYQTTTTIPTQSPTTQSTSIQQSSASISQFSFDFSSSQFSGSFSSSPLFSPVTPEPTQPQTTPMLSESSTNIQDQPVIALSDDSFFSGFGSFAQEVNSNSIAKNALSTTSNPVLSPSAPIVVSIPNITSQGISSGSAISVPISQFVLSNKWLLTWLNGITSLPLDFTHVYLIFTTSRIILYCPCNTFYTSYQLQNNNLINLKWQGTKNQCETNRDSLITNFIFYSTAVRQSGQNILFYYGTRAKMAEFRPYY